MMRIAALSVLLVGVSATEPGLSADSKPGLPPRTPPSDPAGATAGGDGAATDALPNLGGGDAIGVPTRDGAAGTDALPNLGGGDAIGVPTRDGAAGTVGTAGAAGAVANILKLCLSKHDQATCDALDKAMKAYTKCMMNTPAECATLYSDLQAMAKKLGLELPKFGGSGDADRPTQDVSGATRPPATQQGQEGDKCFSDRACGKGLFCHRTAKIGAGQCRDQCMRMRCTPCKRGVCESEPAGGENADEGKPECPAPEECDAVWPCVCVKERDDNGCVATALKCKEAPEGCVAYSVDGCNWCKVDDDQQITQACTKRKCDDSDDFCSLAERRPGCKQCKEDMVLRKGKCYPKDNAPPPPLKSGEVCYSSTVNRRHDCPPCTTCVKEKSADGPTIARCRKLGARKPEETCEAENACAPGLFCEGRTKRRAARTGGVDGGLGDTTGAGELGGTTGIEAGQQRCCARKVDGCECLSSSEGSCSPECDHILKPDSADGTSGNTAAMRDEIIACWKDATTLLPSKCVAKSGWSFMPKDIETGIALDKCSRQICQKNGARTTMVSDGEGGCKCPSFVLSSFQDSLAQVGESCTGTLDADFRRVKPMMTSRCAGMVCQQGDSAIVFMVQGEQGCKCPDAKDTTQAAKFCAKGLRCGDAGKCEAEQLPEGECKEDAECGEGSKCAVAPSTGFEIVAGVGKCVEDSEASEDAPGVCKDLCALRRCPGACSNGVCAQWKGDTAVRTKPAKRKCDDAAGEIAVKKGFEFKCEKAAKKALLVTYKGMKIDDLTPARELQLRERVISDTMRSNAKLGMTRADIVDVNFFGVDSYIEGQKRCCKRTSNGCACLSEDNGSCRPKCNDYLPEQFQDGGAQTQGSDPGRLRRAQNDQVTATVAFAPSVTVADVQYEDSEGLDMDDGLKLTFVEDQLLTAETAGMFQADPGSQPTNEPTNAPTGPSGGPVTTEAPDSTTTEGLPDVDESAATTATTTVAIATVLAASALWF